MLGQDRVVDGGEGLLAREAHGKHAEVALPGKATDPGQAALGDRLAAGLPSWAGGGGAGSTLGTYCLVGMVGTDSFPPWALYVVKPH